MTERATNSQAVTLAVEGTAGTLATANFYLLNSMGLDVGIQADIMTFRPRGTKYTTIAALGKEWTESGINGIGDYNEIEFPLSSVLTAPTLGTVTTGGTAYTYTIGAAGASSDAPKTFSVYQGEGATRVHRFTYGIVTDFGVSWTRDSIDLSGSMLGRAITDGVSFPTPSSLALAPILPQHVCVYVEATYAALGTATAWTRVLSADWTISGKYNPLYVLDCSQTSWVAHVEADPTSQLKLKVEANAQGMGLLDIMRAGTRKYIRIASTGGTVSGTYTYLFRFDMAGVITDVAPFEDVDGVFAIEWTFDTIWDGTHAIDVFVRNAVNVTQLV